MFLYRTLTLREPLTEDLLSTASSTDSSWGNLNLLTPCLTALFPNSESLATSLKGGFLVVAAVTGGGVAVGAGVEAPAAPPVIKK